MTQMADEIRTLTVDLYNNSEGSLKRLLQWSSGRSTSELFAVQAGQFVLLKVPLRRRPHAAR
jgi:hypothetical protein